MIQLLPTTKICIYSLTQHFLSLALRPQIHIFKSSEKSAMILKESLSDGRDYPLLAQLFCGRTINYTFCTAN